MRRPHPPRHVHAVVVVVRGRAAVVSWALQGPGDANLTLVEGLARLQLTAHRLGCHIVLSHVCADLSELLDLAGLAGPLGASAPEVVGEPEAGEERGVEEAVVPDDPVA